MTDAQEIVWGDPIAVDGKRPGFVRDEDAIDVRSDWVPKWYSDASGGNVISSSNIDWSQVAAIRLPADHPHYGQPAPIDWSGKLEAVHEDGRVVAVALASTDYDGDHHTLSDVRGMPSVWRSNGRAWVGDEGSLRGWRIRNVTPQPTPQADTKPDVATRMEALVRGLAEGHRGSWTWAAEKIDEARAIVALLPEPVDPDLIEAREICARHALLAPCEDPGLAAEYRAGECDSQFEIMAARAALARGRELALAGETGK